MSVLAVGALLMLHRKLCGSAMKKMESGMELVCFYSSRAALVKDEALISCNRLWWVVATGDLDAVVKKNNNEDPFWAAMYRKRHVPLHPDCNSAGSYGRNIEVLLPRRG